MRAITSKEELLKKLKKENILSDGHICYLTNFHKTKVGKVLVLKLIRERVLEKTVGMGSWFETQWKLRKPVGTHQGVEIFEDQQRNQFFFRVPKGVYDIDTYELCIKKIEYLKNLGEKLK
ncbi:hypothetical protein ACSV4D_09360 [Flavobacterium sp. ARAG 55.4]|uniref:hypothetical protein n=1 Tax=Flavobacterium sp. ARAG 55.4 TaxID=3451357 RepID=UPI003F48973D